MDDTVYSRLRDQQTQVKIVRLLKDYRPEAVVVPFKRVNSGTFCAVLEIDRSYRR